MQYKLFPFNKIKFGSKIAIYGAGEIYNEILQQIKATNWCQVNWLIDRKFSESKSENEVLHLPLGEMDLLLPDYIVIASLKFSEEIYFELTDRGVGPDRIIKIDSSNVINGDSHRLSKTPATTDWNQYYKDAEEGAEIQFEQYLLKFVDENSIDTASILDFACGEGRIAQYFIEKAKKIHLVDVSQDSIELCKKRFKGRNNITFLCNKDGGIHFPDNSVTFIYSWDAMVHFNYKSLDYYICEFNRLLSSGGFAFIHHSNILGSQYAGDIFEQWNLNPHCRSNISKEDVAFIASHYDFKIVNQVVIDWEIKYLDCITILQKR